MFDNKEKFFTWVDEGGDTNFFNKETKELLGKTPDNEIRTYHIVDDPDKMKKIDNKIAEIKLQQNGQ